MVSTDARTDADETQKNAEIDSIVVSIAFSSSHKNMNDFLTDPSLEKETSTDETENLMTAWPKFGATTFTADFNNLHR